MTPEKYWETFLSTKEFNLPMPEAWMFGDGSEAMGDSLGKLVLEGKKRATCSAYCLYEIENEEIPKKGEYSIILNGKKQPIAIIQTTKIEFIKMNEVTPDFSRMEGEGDLSHDYWYKVHEEYFTKELKRAGLSFTPELLLVCETFEVINF